MIKQKFFLLALILFSTILIISCNTKPESILIDRQIDVIINDIPFKTDKYLRIPYTLKTWQYEKEGLFLEKILVIDRDTKKVLDSFSKINMPKIFKKSSKKTEFFTFDSISNYYLSIQIAIPLGENKPKNIFHRFILKDSLQKKEFIVENGNFSPRLNENPLVISSPVKGKNWVFFNQSTNDYHFFSLFFYNKQVSTGERFATDIIQLNDSMTNYFEGNTKANKSYFCYKDTLYAVANGTIVALVDGRPENMGDMQNIKFKSLDEYAGNYLILDIGNGNYAMYAHCFPGGFKVKLNDKVKEGEPIALLGNSGNSTFSHLHFQITDKNEIFFSNGVPYVIKNYTKTADFNL